MPLTGHYHSAELSKRSDFHELYPHDPTFRNTRTTTTLSWIAVHLGTVGSPSSQGLSLRSNLVVERAVVGSKLLVAGSSRKFKEKEFTMKSFISLVNILESI